MSSWQPYHISVVPQELRPAETYARLCHSLTLLQETADDIFNVIVDRVGEEHGKLGEAAARIKAAQAKIDTLSQSKGAARVFCLSRYPAPPPSSTDYVPLFTGVSPGRRRGVALPREPPAGRQEVPRGSEEAAELFRFFATTRVEPPPLQRHPPEWLGPPPTTIESVADLHLFTSPALPSLTHTEESQRGAPPGTASPPPPPRGDQGRAELIGWEDTGLEDEEAEFVFRPTASEVGGVVLPSLLPDLPMATELMEEDLSVPSPPPPPFIAQSVNRGATAHATPEGPATSSPSLLPSPSPPPPSSPSLSSDPPSTPPPPSAPMSLTADVTNQTEEHDVPSSSPLRSPPPPPPRPPPRPSPKPSTPPGTSHRPPPVTPPSDGDAGRAALLDSIRNPSMRLRKVRKEEEGGAVASSPPPPLPKVDLMGEMAATLKLRRTANEDAPPRATPPPIPNPPKVVTPILEEDARPGGASPRLVPSPPVANKTSILNLRAMITQKFSTNDGDDPWSDEE